MPGANYMGGRRNAARAKTKDISGRIQRGHFMKQRHQILARGLQDPSTVIDSEASSRSKGSLGRIEDICLLAARKDLERKASYDINTVNRVSLGHPTSSRMPGVRSVLLTSSSPEPSKELRIRRSKVLEALDTNDKAALRRTMNRLLCIPDLAGLESKGSDIRPKEKNNKKRDGSLLASPMKESPRKKQKSVPESPPSIQSISTMSPVQNRQLFHSKPQKTQSSSSNTDSNYSPRTISDDVLRHDLKPLKESSDTLLDRLSVVQEYSSGSLDHGFEELSFMEDTEEYTPSLCSSRRSDYMRKFRDDSSSPEDSPGLSLPDCAKLPVFRDSSVKGICHSETHELISPSADLQGTHINLLDYSDPLSTLHNIIGAHFKPESPFEDDLSERNDSDVSIPYETEEITLFVNNQETEPSLPSPAVFSSQTDVWRDTKCYESGATEDIKNYLTESLINDDKENNFDSKLFLSSPGLSRVPSSPLRGLQRDLNRASRVTSLTPSYIPPTCTNTELKHVDSAFTETFTVSRSSSNNGSFSIRQRTPDHDILASLPSESPQNSVSLPLCDTASLHTRKYGIDKYINSPSKTSKGNTDSHLSLFLSNDNHESSLPKLSQRRNLYNGPDLFGDNGEDEED